MDKHFEFLAKLYLRLKGFIVSNLIIHSDVQGNSKSELDIVAIRMPFHSQDYRSDFWYPNPEHKPNEIFMIRPEFENEKGEVILENDISVPDQGTAKMWIVGRERRPYHYEKIVVGLKGYFMEGSNRVAECEVIEILNLKSNTIS